MKSVRSAGHGLIPPFMSPFHYRIAQSLPEKIRIAALRSLISLAHSLVVIVRSLIDAFKIVVAVIIMTGKKLQEIAYKILKKQLPTKPSGKSPKIDSNSDDVPLNKPPKLTNSDSDFHVDPSEFRSEPPAWTEETKNEFSALIDTSDIEAEIAKLKEALPSLDKEQQTEQYKKIHQKRGNLLAREFSKEGKSPPYKSFVIDDRVFYISKLKKCKNNQYFALLYTTDSEGKLTARVLFQPRKSGLWSSFSFVDDKNKALQEDNHTSLVQVSPDMLSILIDMENEPQEKTDQPLEKIETILSPFRIEQEEVPGAKALFLEEVKPVSYQSPQVEEAIRKVKEYYIPADLRSLGPEEESKRPKQEQLIPATQRIYEELNKLLQAPELRGFVPDFTKEPIFKYKKMHQSMGWIDIEVYSSTLDDKKYEWHMAHSPDGEVWIDKIPLKGATTNSHGTSSTYESFGLMTCLPKVPASSYPELRGFCEGIIADKGSDYIHTRFFLDQLPPLRAYAEAKKLPLEHERREAIVKAKNEWKHDHPKREEK